jgi:hypothetical protein
MNNSMLNNPITTPDQAKAFIKMLYESGYLYHPDDDTHEVLWSLATPSKRVLDLMNTRMSECFEVDWEYFKDVYGYCLYVDGNFSSAAQSSHGCILFNPDTGVVVDYDLDNTPDAESYKNIERFDLDEYKKHHGCNHVIGADIDILDLGYWLKDGTYEEPAHDWREEANKLSQ